MKNIFITLIAFILNLNIVNSIDKKTILKWHNQNLRPKCNNCVCYSNELEHYVITFKTTKITKKNCDILLKKSNYFLFN